MRRRRFLAAAAMGTAGPAGEGMTPAAAPGPEAAATLAEGGRDFSPATREERERVPSTCWQCVSRCPIVGYLEQGRLAKIEGHPESLDTGGKICARGQAGINQLYNPDRLLHPLKRLGRRGEGRWQRISWKEALDLLVEGGEIAGHRVQGLRELRESGTPERFMFHYGRTLGTEASILFQHFLPAYGTATVGDHNSICIGAGGIGRMLTPGPSAGPGFEKAEVILNFGASLLDAGFGHVSTIRRCRAALDRGARLYTFDVRLSNTAARSTEWIPVKPGTDLAVILAMCRELLTRGAHDRSFLEEHTNVTAEELLVHLDPYTLEWAEEISGVPAAKIEAIAGEYAGARPGMCIGLRGLFMHYNGVQAQRALYMLQALGGGVDLDREFGPSPRWNHPFPVPEGEAKALGILDGEEGAYAFTDYRVSHQIVHMLDKGPERPALYMVYCHNPVYSNGDCRGNARVYADETKVPFLVAVDVALSETSELADLVLPDATYLERWSLAGRTSPGNVPEYGIQQPMHPPLGEARNFVDVACEIGERLGLDLGFRSAEEYIRASCDSTPGVREAGGFEYMKRRGLWHDRQARPFRLPAGDLQIRSERLEEKGFSGIPAWMPIPGHDNLADDEFVLTTFKVPVQTHSRTQGCKWLTELFHDNPAWMNPASAAARGIRNGDRIRVISELGEIITTAHVTEGVHPEAIGIANSAGHWAWGEYASGRPSAAHRAEADSSHKWWRETGAHPNIIIPNRGDPIAGSMCWMDTVVRVEKA